MMERDERCITGIMKISCGMEVKTVVSMAHHRTRGKILMGYNWTVGKKHIYSRGVKRHISRTKYQQNTMKKERISIVLE